MIKSDTAQNPHLFQRDIEKVVNYWTKWSKLCVAETESNCRVSERFQLSSEKHARGAIPVPVLSSRSQRKLTLSSRQERRCARVLIGKQCRQPEQLALRFRLIIRQGPSKGFGRVVDEFLL
jgi:hypothetical protein